MTALVAPATVAPRLETGHGPLPTLELTARRRVPDNSKPALLSVGSLDALKERWAARGMPLLTRLSPGLSSTEIDELVAPLELQVPDEAKLWWGWHDGVPAHAVTRDSERWLGPGRAFIPLAEAVEQYRQRLQIAHHLATDSGLPDHDADSWWSREWFPITGSEIGIACDCSASADAPTPIRAIHWHTMRLEELRTIRAPSLGELVGWWIEAFDVGAWDYDPARDQWDYQYERLSRARQLAVLV